MNERDDLEKRMTRVEDALWGPFRNNGLVSDVKAIRREIETQARKRQEEEQLEEQKEVEDKRDRVRNRLTVVGITLAGLASLFTAVWTIVHG